MRAYDPSLDSADPGWRGEFLLPPFEGDAAAPGGAFPEVAYFAGNSLGLQPRATRAALEVELDRWALWGVEGQLTGPRPWKDYHEALRDPAARLVGALPHETVIMNTLTANLHFMMATFYRPAGRRTKIVMEDIVFPSDGYAIASQARWHGLDPAEHVIRMRPREGEDVLRTEDVVARIRQLGDEVAMVVFSAVNYLTGEWMDMPAITDAAHEVGAIAGWDLAHAAGNVPMRLHDWGVDWAAWCSYKYLNSGPGAVAGCFVHERHARDTSLPRLAGWWGTRTDTRFRMEPGFDPPPTADAWQVSNPPIFAMTPVQVSLEIFDRVGMDTLRERSLRLTAYLRSLVDEIAAELPAGSLTIVTPAEDARHGCQLSLRFQADIRVLADTLRDLDGVIADTRNPDIIRFAPVPLYTSYLDCWRAADSLLRRLS
ncbi:MAG: kynureninase [Candidatus Nanopelagicales bacterium]